MAGQFVHEFTDANFKSEVLQSSVPVLVDFWAEWCGPCRALAPTIDAIAADYNGRVKVGKVDTDKNQAVAMEYQISAIPTVLVFKDGKLAKQIVGLTNKAKLAETLDGLLK